MAQIEKRYYISPMRLNARIADTVIEDDFITIEGYKYIRLTRAPKGKSILRRIRAVENDNLRFTIYK